MTSVQDEFGKSLLLSMAPLDGQDFNGVKQDMTKLGLWSDELVKEYNIKTCRTGSSSSDTFSQEISLKLKEYQNGLYQSKGMTARYMVDDEHNIRTYAESIVAGSTAGSWMGIWTIAEGDTQLTGSVTLHAHYAEHGSNVHMHAMRQFGPKTIIPAADAGVIVDSIIEWEKDLHSELTAMFDDAIPTSLRKVRRILPITKTRFKWDSAAQAQVKLLNARAAT